MFIFVILIELSRPECTQLTMRFFKWGNFSSVIAHFDLGFTYRKVANSSTSHLVSPPRVYRLFMKRKFNAYLL